MIIVGCSLATQFPRRIVASMLERNIPVIEVNMESAINRGNNIQVLGKSEEALPELFEEFYRLTKQQKTQNTTAEPAKKPMQNVTKMLAATSKPNA